jgi:glutaryl-CoA dehydrogenase
MTIGEYGGPGFSHLESGCMAYELCKRDASIGVIVANHNGIGNNVIDACGNQEQKDRILSQTINMKKFIGFGLTEPLNGSDASALKTTAKKVDGGYLLNGEKKWPGNGTFADYMIVWARNLDDEGRI